MRGGAMLKVRVKKCAFGGGFGSRWVCTGRQMVVVKRGVFKVMAIWAKSSCGKAEMSSSR